MKVKVAVCPGVMVPEGGVAVTNQPVAQLLYSIGKHRVSVFILQRSGAAEAKELVTERSGFHVMDFSTNDLEGVAVSDVDPGRLAQLVSSIKHAQSRK